MTTFIYLLIEKIANYVNSIKKYLAQKARHDNIKSSIFHFSVIRSMHSPRENNNIMIARGGREIDKKASCRKWKCNIMTIFSLNDDFETNEGEL